MRVKVIRGSNQIGGSIIEIASKETTILLDAGCELEEPIPPNIPKIDGLFQGEKKYDAILVSHYHMDHTGLLNYVLDDIPIYMAKKMFSIFKLSMEYMSKSVEFQPTIFNMNDERMDGTYSFKIKDITVTPFLCDHSAYDSYMYLLESDGDTILYTGDFRSNGRKSFRSLLKRLPQKVNKLIIEGTTINRIDVEKNVTEQGLQKEFEAVMQSDSPIFVLTASTNIDRIVSVYKASVKTKRTMMIDTYLAQILSIAGGGVPTPKTHSNMRVYRLGNSDRTYNDLQPYIRKSIKREQLVQQRYTMCIRTSRDMKKYLKKMSEYKDLHGSILIYSMWEGYRQKFHMKKFLEYCESLGMRIICLHTSGHADKEALLLLKNHVNPKEIIPVHTMEPELLRKVLCVESE